ncbi:UNVERIFIED_CONTAM: hypothetical protein FKN15_028031 [Acipenser sinensis]
MTTVSHSISDEVKAPVWGRAYRTSPLKKAVIKEHIQDMLWTGSRALPVDKPFLLRAAAQSRAGVSPQPAPSS